MDQVGFLHWLPPSPGCYDFTTRQENLQVLVLLPIFSVASHKPTDFTPNRGVLLTSGGQEDVLTTLGTIMPRTHEWTFWQTWSGGLDSVGQFDLLSCTESPAGENDPDIP